VPLRDMDLKTGLRMLEQDEIDAVPAKSWKTLPMRVVHGLF
jgi:amino acid transporter